MILCGGKGRRLGITGEKVPKAMVKVGGYPILWYTIMQLHAAGFRHFVLPLGYRGDQIQAYIDGQLNWLNARIDAVRTGEDTGISERLYRVQHLLPDGPFLLANGDCLFDLDLDALYELHANRKALLTLTSCRVVSQYGLIAVEGNEVIAFCRDAQIRSFDIETERDGTVAGYVNAGITLIDKKALDEVDLLKSDNFEIELFSRLIEMRRAAHLMINGYWYAIETQKDLDIANSGDKGDARAVGARKLRDTLLRHQAALELGLNRT